MNKHHKVQNVTSHLAAFSFQQHMLHLIDLHHHATKVKYTKFLLAVNREV